MKQSEVKSLSLEELKENFKKYKGEYVDLKLLHAVTPLENPMRLRKIRKAVARLSTEISKRS